MTNQSNLQWEPEPSDPEISVDAMPAIPRTKTDEGSEQSVQGERFGKYLIVGEVALGGMAELFLGVQRGLEGFTKVVVIKRVLPQFSTNPEFVQMFIDEARLAARLEHPNIVRTYEFGEVDGSYFTAMEYLAGEDLSKTLNRLAVSKQSMPMHIAVGIVSQICSGLHFAHNLTDLTGEPLNLIHRDVNPSNIVMTYGGEVKIVDFGIAKTNTQAQTVSGTIKGKLAYMSPEQLLARGIDQRSDVFSVGVVLWEVLTGRPLFMRDSEAGTLYAIMNDPIPPPSRYRKEIPPELDAIVGRALARPLADRYETAEELGDALEAMLETMPKYDARVLGRTMEELFGSTRAEAKRSIAQTRSLSRNVSLVMKLRSEVRSDLAETLDSITSDVASSKVRTGPASLPTAPPSRSMTWLWAMLIIACIAGGLLFVMYGTHLFSDGNEQKSTQAVAESSVRVESAPPGAAIAINGEPTGLKTPATLTGIAAEQITISLEMPGFPPVTETIQVPKGGTVSKHFSLEQPGPGRLVVAGLPKNAVLVVDGDEYDAGTVVVVPAGTHDVRVVVNGRTLAKQTLETKTGEQKWKFVDDKLVAN